MDPQVNGVLATETQKAMLETTHNAGQIQQSVAEAQKVRLAQSTPIQAEEPAAVNNNPEEDKSVNAGIYLGLPLGPNGSTVTLKHTAPPEAATGILTGGFDPNKGALQSGYTWFQSTEQNQTGGPSTRNQTVRLDISIPDIPQNTPTLSYDQHHQWYMEERAKLQQNGFTGSELDRRANAARWQRVSQFLAQQKSPIYSIELKGNRGSYVLLKNDVLKNAQLTKISGPDAKQVVENLSTSGKWGVGVKFGATGEKLALQVLGGDKPGAIKTAEIAGLSEAATKRFGTTATVMKWGGRTLVFVGAIKDGYEIYTAENKPRTITSVVSGWSGAWVGMRGGAWVGARIGGGIALVGGQLGPQAATPEEVITVPVASGLGGIIGGFGGGIGGYIFGREITETVYDWVFTKQ